ncbi:MAG: cell division protein FtsZ [Christensenellaceae bacterium]|jgi:cell division protein FtsZ|nr:cell division protein FtsZ [Christensenellaceae bacterium]
MPVGVANIKVIGVGGGGNNAVNRMIHADIKNATFIAANTDMQALNMSLASIKIQLGATLTQGLGAGADPEIGKRAAEESAEDIKESIKDANLLFITAGMGGGTGTGATPIIADIAKEMGILTIAVVTKPLNFEGKKRMENAVRGIDRLRESVDTLLVVPNEKVNSFVGEHTSLIRAFQIADDILRQGIQGISDIISTPALINLDFADIRTIMKNKGNAHIGIGRASGETRTFDAVRQAVQNPLLDSSIQGATGIIVYIAGDESLALDEMHNAIDLVKEVVDDSANIIWGVGIDKSLDKDVTATIIATGFGLKSESPRFISRPFTEEAQHQNKERMNTWYGEPIGTQTPPVQAVHQERVAPLAPPIQSIPMPQLRVPTEQITQPRTEVPIDNDSDLPEFLRKIRDGRR